MTVSTEIGYTTPDAIHVRGRDLARDILGKLDFVDMLCVLNWGREPEPREKAMLNLCLVTAADHGLTPSAMSARLTWSGAPESLQGAVAAGLLGAGDRLLGTAEKAARLYAEHAAALEDACSDEQLAASARALVQACRAQSRGVPGVGHPIHVNGDPRVPVLASVSRENGYYGRHWRLAVAVAEALGQALGRPMPLNAAGATGAIIADMGLDPAFARGLALVGRTAGLVAHVLEERRAPIGGALWDLALAQDPRNVLPQRSRG
ncbi:citryl-CoA lyase [Verticiella sediminum]|uniref:citrate synthase (unknown stereospecificity) n=1 Tax=Verticiella sediminum TaxID=1247510 RepID=A0A556AFW1_9BURK|nr:citryl-CoA lyase [Verticiella sediminum]TSH91778.1 citryl-CoA lyase [Verticiella sediminum]